MEAVKSNISHLIMWNFQKFKLLFNHIRIHYHSASHCAKNVTVFILRWNVCTGSHSATEFNLKVSIHLVYMQLCTKPTHLIKHPWLSVIGLFDTILWSFFMHYRGWLCIALCNIEFPIFVHFSKTNEEPKY